MVEKYNFYAADTDADADNADDDDDAYDTMDVIDCGRRKVSVSHSCVL